MSSEAQEGASRGEPSKTTGAAAPSASGSASELETTPSKEKADDADGAMEDCIDEAETVDSVWEKAPGFSLMDVGKVSITTSNDNVLADLRAHVSPHEKLLVILDCRTSKANVFSDFLGWFGREAKDCVNVENVKYCIAAGKHVDMLLLLNQKLKSQSVSQSQRLPPTYVVRAQGSLLSRRESVPSRCVINGCHSAAVEKLWQRCRTPSAASGVSMREFRTRTAKQRRTSASMTKKTQRPRG